MSNRIYELAVLYSPELGDDLAKAVTKVKKLIKDVDGQIVKEDDWGELDLAYPIRGFNRAHYVFYDIEIQPQVVGKLEAGINVTNQIIRHLISKPDLKALAKAMEAAKYAVDEQPAEAAEDSKPPARLVSGTGDNLEKADSKSADGS